MGSLAHGHSPLLGPPTTAPHLAAGPLDAVVRRLLLRADPARGVVIGITSAIDGEGKTMVAHDLARGLSTAATQERPVLLLDCDRRSYLVDEPGCGDQGARSMVLDVPGLRYRPFQALQAESLARGGPTLFESFQALRAYHAFIVVDMPSVLTDPVTDELAGEVDRLFLVVRAGATPGALIREAIARLSRAMPEGVILNDVRRPRHWLMRLVS